MNSLKQAIAALQRPCTPTTESRSVMMPKLSAAGDGQRYTYSDNHLA
ncbi:hypothetical protein V2H45_23915 [Tumidithrix elongata RA019]|uniref:Uncharacterized protein n=1 Tax=Tumidithrix elongata BACA0141 TaxID=2716417 RepID=A0AAW9Q6I1_9CYAN|nr:hypothetical protein [Tumidithrix elongata RA019]